MRTSDIWQEEQAEQAAEPLPSVKGDPTAGSGPSERVPRERFAPIYEQYRPRIYAYLRTRSPSPEEAADLTHQVFVRVLCGLPGYQGTTPSALTAWLFSIARNCAIDAQRKRRATVSWDGLPEELQGTAAAGPEDTAVRDEALHRLRTVLLSLSAGERELLALRFAGALSSRDIAVLLGVREAAIRQRLVRLIKRVREVYRDAD